RSELTCSPNPCNTMPKPAEIVYRGPSSEIRGSHTCVFEETDQVITQGDHVELRFQFDNIGDEDYSGYEVTIREIEADPEHKPELFFSEDSSSPWAKEVTVAIDIPGRGQETARFCMYIDTVDPYNYYDPNTHLAPFPSLQLAFPDDEKALSVVIGTRTSDILGPSLLLLPSCLHNPDNGGIIEYAQYAIGNQVRGEWEKDADTDSMMVKNLINRIRLEYATSSGPKFRFTDISLLGYRDLAPIGQCVQFVDLASGLLRGLGIPTREVRGRRPLLQGGAVHFWVEVFGTKGNTAWRPVNIMASEDNRFYDAAGRNLCAQGYLTYVMAGLNSLPNKSTTTWWGCDEDCSPPECPDRCFHCTGILCDPDGCWDFAVDYGQAASSGRDRRGERELLDSLLVEVTAPTAVAVGSEFPAQVVVSNGRSSNLSNLLVHIDSYPMAGFDARCYSCTGACSVIVEELAAGDKDTLDWQLMPLLAGRPMPLVFYVETDGFVASSGVSQSVMEQGGQPKLLSVPSLYQTGYEPAQEMLLRCWVGGEELQPIADASVACSLRSLSNPRTADAVPLEYSSEDSTYVGSWMVPGSAHLGEYQAEFFSDLVNFESDTSSVSFAVAPQLAMELSSLGDTLASADTLRLVAAVSIGDELVDGASVNAMIAAGSYELNFTMACQADSLYSLARVPRQLLGDLGGDGSLLEGDWRCRVTAGYYGSEICDSLVVHMMVPDLQVTQNDISFSSPDSCIVDSIVSILATVRNVGGEGTDTSAVRFMADALDSTGTVIASKLLLPIAPGDSASVNATWDSLQASHEIFVVVDSYGDVVESDESNNVASSWLEFCGSSIGEWNPDNDDAMSSTLKLEASSPNPFLDKTRISFALPHEDQVQLCIYDVAGRRVATLLDGQKPAGTHSIFWDGRRDDGVQVGSGILFYRLVAGDRTLTRQMVVIR
ncbi:CARDB domain-containing protein, partial [Candidatus Eisenbacteria bacterium]